MHTRQYEHNLCLKDYAKIGLFSAGMGALEFLKDIDEGAYLSAPIRAVMVATLAGWAALKTNTNPNQLAGLSFLLNVCTGEGLGNALLHCGTAGFVAEKAGKAATAIATTFGDIGTKTIGQAVRR